MKKERHPAYEQKNYPPDNPMYYYCGCVPLEICDIEPRDSGFNIIDKLKTGKAKLDEVLKDLDNIMMRYNDLKDNKELALNREDFLPEFICLAHNIDDKAEVLINRKRTEFKAWGWAMAKSHYSVQVAKFLLNQIHESSQNLGH